MSSFLKTISKETDGIISPNYLYSAVSTYIFSYQNSVNMPLYGLLIFYKGAKPKFVKSSFDLTSFNFFQRGGIKEFLEITSEQLVRNSSVPSTSSMKEQMYMFYNHVESDSLAGVAVTDHAYPESVAQSLINKGIACVKEAYGNVNWTTMTISDNNYPVLDNLVKEYQDPNNVQNN